MEYDRIIDMLCLTGKMPVNLFDKVTEYARQSIASAIAMADEKETRRARRDREIFGEIADFKASYKSEWLDYEEEWLCNVGA